MFEQYKKESPIISILGMGGGVGSYIFTAPDTGYEIARSLRFNSADSAYLSRTPASAGNRKTWTWAGWVKLSNISMDRDIFAATDDGTSWDVIKIRSGGSFRVYFDQTTNGEVFTTGLFRDPSAWYHFCFVLDTTQAVAADRFNIYVNGVLQTLTGTRPGQDTEPFINGVYAHTIARGYNNGVYFDGYLADVHFIDGQALDPTSFGEFDADTGVWQPKRYTGTYGTNGFHLPFSDNSSASALGTDDSGNGNDWTVNNISVTAGSGNDSLLDSPTNGTEEDTGIGAEVGGNYATLNALNVSSVIALSNGNLQYLRATTTSGGVTGTIGMSSGKWYWEVTVTSSAGNCIGLATKLYNPNSFVGGDAESWMYYQDDGSFFAQGNNVGYGDSFTTNDVIGVAFDADNLTLEFFKNNVSQGLASYLWPGTSSRPYFPVFGAATSSNVSGIVNFGQRPFVYTAPEGFKALNTANLATPSILKGSDYVGIVTYTGNGTSQTISGLDFSPDFVWIKNRSDGTQSHGLFDVIRGVDKWLSTNAAAAETDYGGGFGLLSFTSDGFSVGNGGATNGNGDPLVAWTWDGGSSTVTNNDGSISSQVRANPSAGFSIVTYTGTGANATIGHGLGVAPSLVIVKCRSDGSTDWPVYHASLGAGNRIYLSNTSAASSGTNWNSTAPTSSVFSVGTNPDTNGSSRTYVTYCFAPVEGYSAFGSYTGNGSANGPFAYTGFRPAFLLIRRTDTIGDWIIHDAARDTYNVTNKDLYPNDSVAENTSGSVQVDFLSNGFKLTSTSSNASGGNYIYASFAENPFSIARAR